MTFFEGRRRTLLLLDEYENGAPASDAESRERMAEFFDGAQKRAAQVSRIVRRYDVPLAAGKTEYAPPADFAEASRVFRNGKRTRRYDWRGASLIIDDAPGSVTLEYFALPATINKDTPDSYVFEVSESAAQALPFYVAAQLLLSDVSADGGVFLAVFEALLCETPRIPRSYSLKNVLFGGER